MQRAARFAFPAVLAATIAIIGIWVHQADEPAHRGKPLDLRSYQQLTEPPAGHD